MAPMDARSRVRQFLARGTADRPPFLAMATEYTARLAQCTAGELLADPGLFVRSFSESVAVLGLEAVLIEIPAADVLPVAAGGEPAAARPRRAAGGPAPAPCDAARPGRHRGPAARAVDAGRLARGRRHPDSLDDLVAGLIGLQEYLGPAGLDALALLERAG